MNTSTLPAIQAIPPMQETGKTPAEPTGNPAVFLAALLQQMQVAGIATQEPGTAGQISADGRQAASALPVALTTRIGAGQAIASGESDETAVTRQENQPTATDSTQHDSEGQTFPTAAIQELLAMHGFQRMPTPPGDGGGVTNAASVTELDRAAISRGMSGAGKPAESREHPEIARTLPPTPAGAEPKASVHSLSRREGAGGRENLEIAGIDDRSPHWGEKSGRLPPKGNSAPLQIATTATPQAGTIKPMPLATSPVNCAPPQSQGIAERPPTSGTIPPKSVMALPADPVTVHSPSRREGVGGRENLDFAGIDNLPSLPTSPHWGEGSERLHIAGIDNLPSLPTSPQRREGAERLPSTASTTSIGELAPLPAASIEVNRQLPDMASPPARAPTLTTITQFPDRTNPPATPVHATATTARAAAPDLASTDTAPALWDGIPLERALAAAIDPAREVEPSAPREENLAPDSNDDMNSAIAGTMAGVGRTVGGESAPTRISLENPVGSAGWGDELGRQIAGLTPDSLANPAPTEVKTAEFRLNPAHLGPLQVRIEMHGDQASVRFTSAHGEVREAIANALPHLREMFGAHHLILADTSVAPPSLSPQMDFKGGQGHPQHQGFDFQQQEHSGQTPQYGGQQGERGEEEVPVDVSHPKQSQRARSWYA